MKYLILPNNCNPTELSSWKKTNEVDLGGFFYDHIKSKEGNLIGIRYYIEDGFKPKEHPVFNYFITDPRFHFDAINGYIDIFFKYIREEDSFTIDVVQDFGGDHVLKNHKEYGIMVEI